MVYTWFILQKSTGITFLLKNECFVYSRISLSVCFSSLLLYLKPCNMFLKPLCWGGEEDPGSPKDKHCEEGACSSALPSPHCPTRQHTWHGCHPNASRVVWTVARAPCSEQGRKKLLAEYQLPAHCSCKWKSWGCMAWAADLSMQEWESFVMVVGIWEPRASNSLPGVFAACTGMVCTCAGDHGAYMCIILVDASGFGIICCVTTT